MKVLIRGAFFEQSAKTSHRLQPPFAAFDQRLKIRTYSPSPYNWDFGVFQHLVSKFVASLGRKDAVCIKQMLHFQLFELRYEEWTLGTAQVRKVQYADMPEIKAIHQPHHLVLGSIGFRRHQRDRQFRNLIRSNSVVDLHKRLRRTWIHHNENGIRLLLRNGPQLQSGYRFGNDFQNISAFDDARRCNFNRIKIAQDFIFLFERLGGYKGHTHCC